ncbi:MAG: hypothetical protein HC783_17965 [Rhodobacteraceae bacterium]|nr:hypothetical protein [Paracoccaceae bacterium]
MAASSRSPPRPNSSRPAATPTPAPSIAAAPRPDPRLRTTDRLRLPGELPDPANVPPGCAFAQRCPLADDHCRRKQPDLRPMGGGAVACHKAAA